MKLQWAKEFLAKYGYAASNILIIIRMIVTSQNFPNFGMLKKK
jgi:hypothetical protein